MNKTIDRTGYCRSCAFVNMCKQCQDKYEDIVWKKDNSPVFTFPNINDIKKE